MSKPSEKYFDKVERWLLGGISIEKMVMSPDQRFRAMLAYEVYQRWLQDKQLRASDVLRNIAAREYPILLRRAAEGDAKAQEYVDAMNVRPGIPRTPTEISNDLALFNHIIGRFEVPMDNIERAKVQDASDWLIREGMKMGDPRSVKSGADLKMDLYNGFKEKDDAEEQMPDSDIVLTHDVSVVKRDRVNYTDEERKKLARRYGLTDKQVIDMIQNSDGTWEIPDEEGDKEPDKDVFDEDPLP